MAIGEGGRVALLISLLACSGWGQVIEWINPTGGAWHEASNWSPAVVPDDPGVTARIGLEGEYTVVVDRDTVVGTLEVLGEGATLRIKNEAILGHEMELLRNDGRIVMLRDGNFCTLRFGSAGVLAGSGLLHATDGRDDSRLSGRVEVGPGESLTNMVSHTVGGALSVKGSLKNHGTLALTGPVTCTQDIAMEATSRVRIVTDSWFQSGAFLGTGTGEVRLGGNLLIEAPDGFELDDLDELLVVKSVGLIAGAFEVIQAPRLPTEVVLRSWSYRDDLGYAWAGVGPACLADLTDVSDPRLARYGVPDNRRDADDFFVLLDYLASGDPRGDLTGSSDPDDPGYRVPDGIVDEDDFFVFLDAFVEPCP